MFIQAFLNASDKRLYKTKSYPAGNYMFKGNNRNTRAMCEICLKLTIKTIE